METTINGFDGGLDSRKNSDLNSFNSEGMAFSNITNGVDKFYIEQLEKSMRGDLFGLNPLSRTINKIKGEMMLQGAEARSKMYGVAVNVRLKILKEQADAGIMMLSANYRQIVTSVVLSKMEKLYSDVSDNQQRIIKKMEEHDEFAATIKDDARRKRYQRTIEMDEVRHFQFLDGLITNFQSILDETLSRYK